MVARQSVPSHSEPAAAIAICRTGGPDPRGPVKIVRKMHRGHSEESKATPPGAIALQAYEYRAKFCLNPADPISPNYFVVRALAGSREARAIR